MAAAVFRSKDCADSMQDTQDRNGDAARFGPRADLLSPGITSDKMRKTASTSDNGMSGELGVTIG
ncbi:hypothetical protein GCM10011309_17230 [Litorimonas cladophorae]|uniref:Uncharacterized protein n=1 Tax=Litorimonas cladophorae TaxID=1220491 RepID=A0A918NHH9_9PROT|nr:hypothetical protein GCM10011309_17230 [Litorimonas cladophorae]